MHDSEYDYTNSTVIRQTLEEYVGDRQGTMTKKQKKAIEDMLGLPEMNFIELVYDIVNEVYRRSGRPHEEEETPNGERSSMREKLTRLKEEKFKSLVYDILVAYKRRYREDDKEDDREVTPPNHAVSHPLGSHPLGSHPLGSHPLIRIIKEEEYDREKALKYFQYIKDHERDREIEEEVIRSLEEGKKGEIRGVFKKMTRREVFYEECDRIIKKEEYKKIRSLDSKDKKMMGVVFQMYLEQVEEDSIRLMVEVLKDLKRLLETPQEDYSIGAVDDFNKVIKMMDLDEEIIEEGMTREEMIRKIIRLSRARISD